jgi:GntR family transcriptional regulator/MocR family aminotransferase
LERTDLRGLIIGYGYATLEDIQRYGPELAKTVCAELRKFGV